jgi:Biopolymer transport proteins
MGHHEWLHRHFESTDDQISPLWRPELPKPCSRPRLVSSQPIPAVLFYNHLARSTGAYLELVSNLSGELLRILSRDLDRGAHADNKIQAAE